MGRNNAGGKDRQRYTSNAVCGVRVCTTSNWVLHVSTQAAVVCHGCSSDYLTYIEYTNTYQP
jgi:hypothetical protein